MVMTMRENKYDDSRFFEAYSRFPRSVHGLAAAGEWRELQRLFPDFEGKRVLDIGCGFGWHCSYAAENGAAYVLGTDISEKMLAVAREKTASPSVEYIRMAMEDINFAADSFDIAISSLALHYTASFEDICQRVYKALADGGSFVFSVEHPVFTAHGSQDWVYSSNGGREHWPVDRYFAQGRRDTIFLGEEVVKYHRTLTAYVGTLLKSGFTLTELVEPQPEPSLLKEMPDELRRPMMLLISAKKPGSVIQRRLY